MNRDHANVLIITGSERRHGITSNASELAKTLFERKGHSVRLTYLCEANFSPCNGCGKGSESCNYRIEPCEKNDDMHVIIKEMLAADIIIYATPVHAFGMAHLMQIFLERAGVGFLRFHRPLANKLGGCIITGRKYNLGQVNDQLVNNMMLNRMIIPGSGFPVLLHGDESDKSIRQTEEIVALEQMVKRLSEVYYFLKNENIKSNWDNERTLKTNKENELEKQYISQ